MSSVSRVYIFGTFHSENDLPGSITGNFKNAAALDKVMGIGTLTWGGLTYMPTQLLLLDLIEKRTDQKGVR